MHCSPLVHAPVATLHVPSAWQVTLGEGMPANPLPQAAVQLVPAVLVAAQAKEPPAGFSGAVLHTADAMAGCVQSAQAVATKKSAGAMFVLAQSQV